MAVASSGAARSLARPLFRRLKVHMRTLNTRTASKPSCLGKRLAIVVQASLTKKATLRLASYQATLHGREPGNKTAHSVLDVNQNPACLLSHLSSDRSEQFIFAAGPYVATTCTMLHLIGDPYLTQSTNV